MSASRVPRVGITLGDPRGIGAEVVESALSDPRVAEIGEFVLIGPSGLLRRSPLHEEVGGWTGEDDAEEAGRLAGRAIERGVQLALAGEIDALVTAPIDKAAFRAGGWGYPGHTEMLQELTGVPEVAMLMASEGARRSGPLRVVLATTHIALRDVPGALTTDLLVSQSLLTADGLRRWWGIPRPRIALCAFNPHASDQGLFGDEEERIYAPALERLADENLQVSGPIPADTVFVRALEGEFDAVVSPYHDVGMAAFKTATFGTGVNVTLGLPFPRTSPDHGTAIDIVGKNIANASSMVEAIRLATRLARVS